MSKKDSFSHLPDIKSEVDTSQDNDIKHNIIKSIKNI